MARRGEYEFTSEIKELARKRDDYTCQECGRHGRTEVHHRIYIEFAKANALPPSLIASLGNALSLCPNCHDEIHKENPQPREEDITAVLSTMAITLPARLRQMSLNLFPQEEQYAYARS